MKTKSIRLRLPPRDTAIAISHATLLRLATHLGMSEIETVHYAVKQLAKEVLPAYEADEGGLTPRQLAAIRKRVPQGRGKRVKSTLF
jgi:hypothetical protein